MFRVQELAPLAQFKIGVVTLVFTPTPLAMHGSTSASASNGRVWRRSGQSGFLKLAESSVVLALAHRPLNFRPALENRWQTAGLFDRGRRADGLGSQSVGLSFIGEA